MLFSVFNENYHVIYNPISFSSFSFLSNSLQMVAFIKTVKSDKGAGFNVKFLITLNTNNNTKSHIIVLYNAHIHTY